MLGHRPTFAVPFVAPLAFIRRGLPDNDDDPTVFVHLDPGHVYPGRDDSLYRLGDIDW